ncbi:MAG: 2-succinyl-5-enolpyruvyl-6-hydroxy-3-cyclohexene-1-carboxylic-acid synthase [Nitriliruptorales bacterium]|nr:2-succinyl-5-enolpyruvyl-6-hydroxy-3-cyclohexene-1-carboxylic-acid synthase [Nitriliruptorales bacterium]
MSAPNLSTAQARVMVEALAQLGVTQAVVCPGSRSAAMALALDAHPDVDVHVAIDERSGAFLALGIARVTGVPAPVVVTSGTAVANLHPAVVEADADGVPFVAVTCDRPARLRGTGANQTIDQPGIFGRAVRASFDVDVLPDEARSVQEWVDVVRAGWAAAIGAGGSRPGPVQLNLQFDEPTVPETDDGRTVGVPFDHATDVAVEPLPAWQPPDVPLSEELSAAGRVTRGLLIIGQGVPVDPGIVQAAADRLGWPVLADPLSGCRPLSATIERASLLAGRDELRPDAVIRVGRTVLARSVQEMLAAVGTHVVIDPWGRSLDAAGSVTASLTGDPSTVLAALPANPLAQPAWVASWREAARVLEQGGHPRGSLEADVTRAVAGAMAAGSTLVIGSSAPVRDLDEWADIPEGVRVLGNRGASGIDGFVSAALGIAVASDGPTVGLCGDLSFLHDRNGLLVDLAGPPATLTLVVIDNGGGQLFRRLPQARQPGFERLFVTPPGVDLAAVAATHRLDLVEVHTPAAAAAAVGTPSVGVRLVRVRV